MNVNANKKRVEITTIIAVVAIITLLFASQNLMNEPALVEKESLPPFLMAQGAHYPVSQILEEQNYKGVFLLPMVENENGRHLPIMRGIYLSQRDGVTTTMTAVTSQPASVTTNLYNSAGNIIHTTGAISSESFFVPLPSPEGIRFSTVVKALDQRIIAEIPNSIFRQTETISITTE